MADHARAALPLIDDLARRMTEGDASTDLRARVLARLPASHTPAFRGWLVTSWLAGSITVLVVLGVIWSRRDAPSVAPPSMASHLGPDSATPPAVSAVTNIAEPRRPSRARRAEVAVRRLPALEIETIQPERLSIAPLSVAPLANEPLRIAAGDNGGSQR